MGTHPIFESDFDCLTAMTVIQNLGIVKHGRRAGTPQETDRELNLNGRQLLLPKTELERIKTHLTREADLESLRRSKVEERKERAQKSKVTVSKWTNTLEGQRLGKLKAAKEREEAEEAERVKIDLEEEMYQQAQRRKVIEKAKKLQFEESDRTKEFHGALLFSEVLKEREYQMKHKKDQFQRDLEYEQNFQARARAENQEALQHELKVKQERRNRAIQNKAEIQNQLSRKKEKKLEKDKIWIEEGKELAEVAKEHEENMMLLTENE